MSPLRKAVGLSAAALGFAGLVALGTWQMERRAWKLDLIARVTERVHATAQPAPARSRWATVTAAGDEYRHVTARGEFRNDAETLVQASTELGPGFWVLTPLRLQDGSLILVNRGFVGPESRAPAAHRAAAGTVAVSGLLRMSEPRGMLLRTNDPAADRWYSRDVPAIARARRLDDVAPYFIDADAAQPESAAGSPGAPVGGLTVIAFRNNHLLYAATWYTLALMIPGALWLAHRRPT
jgi:surfeit locus 1 family protein